jgi:hypothetical protein
MTLDTDIYLISRYQMLLMQEIDKDVRKYRAANMSIFTAVEKFEEEKNVVYEILLKSAAEKGWNEVSVQEALSVVEMVLRYDLTYENYVERLLNRDKICLYFFGCAVDDIVDIVRNERNEPVIRLKEGAVDAYLGKRE